MPRMGRPDASSAATSGEADSVHRVPTTHPEFACSEPQIIRIRQGTTWPLAGRDHGQAEKASPLRDP